jgi:polyhydroxybutyrate depolymerase
MSHVTAPRLALFVTLALLPATRVVSAAPEPTTTTAPKPAQPMETVTVDGVARQYILHVPPGHDPSKPAPLVMVLHGHGGSAGSMVKSTGWNTVADREGFIVAYLQGSKGLDGKNGWNDGIGELGITLDDVKFTRVLAKKLVKKAGVDPRRIYAAGFSNGGGMSYRLGALASDLFAGVAVVEGIVGVLQEDGTYLDIPPAKGPIAIAIMHGKAETTVPYEGGVGTQGGGRYSRPVTAAVKRWAKTDGCTGKPVKTTIIPKKVITTDYDNCELGTEVLFYTLVDGQHQWPTADNAAGISGSEELWKFFSRHPKPAALAKK